MSKNRTYTATRPIVLEADSLERPLEIAFVVAFVLLSLIHAIGPLFDRQDEYSHYYYTHYVAMTGSLPDPASQNHQAHQPPLYHSLMAIIDVLSNDRIPLEDIPDKDFTQNISGYRAILALTNTTASQSLARSPNGITLESLSNLFTPAVRAIYWMRLFNILVGLGTLWIGHKFFRLLWPARPDRRLLAFGVMCFWPLFQTMSTSVSNDGLAYFLTSLVILMMGQWVLEGATWKRAILLGVAMGLNLLTRVGALVLLPFLVVLLLPNPRRMWRYLLVVGLIVLVIAGWWYIRNWLISGDLTSLAIRDRGYTNLAFDPATMSIQQHLERIHNIYRTLWVQPTRLLQPTLMPSNAYYTLLDLFGLVVAGAGVVEIVRYLRRAESHYTRPKTWLFFAYIGMILLLVLVVVQQSTYRVYMNYGRYLLPLILLWSAGVAYSLDLLVPAKWRINESLVTVGAFGVLAIVALFQAYIPQAVPTPAPLLANNPMNLRFGNVIELIGTNSNHIEMHPGQPTRLEVYWRVLKPTNQRLQFYITSNGNILMNSQAPAYGVYLPAYWAEGLEWTEVWLIAAPPSLVPEEGLLLVIGIMDLNAGSPMLIFDQNETPVQAAKIPIVVLP